MILAYCSWVQNSPFEEVCNIGPSGLYVSSPTFFRAARDTCLELAYTYSHEIDVVANDLGMRSNPFHPSTTVVRKFCSKAHFRASGSQQPLRYTGVDALGLAGGTTNRPNQVANVRYPRPDWHGLIRAPLQIPRLPGTEGRIKALEILEWVR